VQRRKSFLSVSDLEEIFISYDWREHFGGQDTLSTYFVSEITQRISIKFGVGISIKTCWMNKFLMFVSYVSVQRNPYFTQSLNECS
jgi:hypothetical protein